MKILITTEWYTPVINGVVNSVLILQRKLQEMGHEVRILTLSHCNQSSMEGNVTYIRARNASWIYPEARIAFHMNSSFIKDIIEWKPDVIHSQCEFSTFLMARRLAKKLDIPIVHTYHTVYEDYTHYFFPNKRIGRVMVSVLTKGVIRRTSYVIAPTDKVKNMLMGYGVKRDIMVVPTGIDLHNFNTKQDKEKLQTLRAKIGIPDGNKVLISIGRLGKEKNLEEIISFLERLHNPEITLVIVGDGPYRSNLEYLVKELRLERQVKFTGMVSPNEVADYYKLGDVFVCASISEAQGLTYMEALAVGVPALCRKDPCLDNVVIDGVNGWQYTSYEHFADRLTAILYQEDLHKTLSRNAHDLVLQEYSSIAFARKVSQVYEKSIASKGH